MNHCFETTFVSFERRKEIIARLKDIEKQENVNILYACESGSRAWGFPSVDSDYDVRFIYVHPIEWYLSIDDYKRDVIERPLENLIDESGWDIRKTLQLLRKSNPPLLEWIQSSIVYYGDPDFMCGLKELMKLYYNPARCMYHYLHMARGNIREYLKGERVWTKKYFYVIRPILACRWIESGLGIVPMEFKKIVDAVSVPSDVRSAIYKLLDDKIAGREMDDGPRIDVFHEFFDTEMRRLDNITIQPKPINDNCDRFDQFFRSMLS
jgi:uncharacterized protein